ncbi:MAG: dTDP-4-dehydrorhamnose reductase [Actinomycetota bacterium]|nr:dTDP-4-dehydrorhamnose reductase [Actinomycetota bacterium]
MKILLTGANGQVGTELAPLIGDHHELVATDIDTLDVSDRDAALGAITSLEPDLILHVGALTNVDLCETEPDQAWKANALGTRHVADGARRVGAHVTYVSTDYVFSGNRGTAYVEWDDPDPLSVYGRSKLAGERELDGSATIVRTSLVCSAHGNNLVKTILRLAGEHDRLTFADDQWSHPTFASDLAAMIWRLSVDRRPGVHHVTNQGVASPFDFARAVLEAAGHDPERVSPIKYADLTPARPAPRPTYSVLDNAALRLEGIGPTRDYREPLAEVVAALRS